MSAVVFSTPLIDLALLLGVTGVSRSPYGLLTAQLLRQSFRSFVVDGVGGSQQSTHPRRHLHPGRDS